MDTAMLYYLTETILIVLACSLYSRGEGLIMQHATARIVNVRT